MHRTQLAEQKKCSGDFATPSPPGEKTNASGQKQGDLRPQSDQAPI
jgi:hypothetical protein